MAQTADRDANQALRARFDEVYGQYQRIRDGLDDLQEQLAAFTLTARSEDGMVTATVGPRGQLVDLRLDRRAYRDHEPDQLAVKITTTVRRASEEASAAVHELVSGYLPPGSGALDYLKDGRFGSLLRRSDAAMWGAAEDD